MGSYHLLQYREKIGSTTGDVFSLNSGERVEHLLDAPASAARLQVPRDRDEANEVGSRCNNSQASGKTTGAGRSAVSTKAR